MYIERLCFHQHSIGVDKEVPARRRNFCESRNSLNVRTHLVTPIPTPPHLWNPPCTSMILYSDSFGMTSRVRYMYASRTYHFGNSAILQIIVFETWAGGCTFVELKIKQRKTKPELEGPSLGRLLLFFNVYTCRLSSGFFKNKFFPQKEIL